MEKFLESCAGFIYNRYAADLKDITIVFPNRRAGVFFSAYLQRRLDKPVLGPEITTVSEWVQSLSPLVIADRLLLITLLYDVFRKETGSTETLDEFYFWGEVLLADFDDIDKYLANARDLFQNIADIKEIEHHFDYLNDDQKAALERFWGSLRNWQQHGQERNFVSLWNKLYVIYVKFREYLLERKTGYPGMVMRHGVENLSVQMSELPAHKYLFVGLNALNQCEKRLFQNLRQAGRAEFFWDYDDFYLQNPVNDAGKFLRENMQLFPPPPDFLVEHTSFTSGKEIRMVAVPSATGQSQVIPEFLTGSGAELPETGIFDHTAVVLADESLLFPVLGALPGAMQDINVTMGYPAKNSPVTGFLQLLANLIRNSQGNEGMSLRIYFRLVTDILNHQMLAGIKTDEVRRFLHDMVAGNRIYLEPQELFFSEIHRHIFTLPGSVSGYSGYFLQMLELLYVQQESSDGNVMVREIIYQVYLALEKLESAISEFNRSGIAPLSPIIFFRLMNQYLGKISVPFEGEPLSGVQVMGILETRCLDFDNLIIIGLNEEIWPRAYTAPSMIPYNLRKSFGLPGIDDQDAMYAYYFYRLIQKAKRVTATWNTIREGVSGGELSRYGFQLMLLSGHDVQSRIHEYPFVGSQPEAIAIRSDRNMATRLLAANTAGRALSPSAINTWLTCSLKFYFRYVLSIEEPDEVSEEIDRRVFGNIFHKAIENLYAPYTGREVDLKTLQTLRKNKPQIEQCILQAFNTEFFKVKDTDLGNRPLEGKARLIFFTIRSYIYRLLELDMRFAPLSIISLERGYYAPFTIRIGDKEHQVTVGGKIDRLDTAGGMLRVIDYKTGNLKNADLSCRNLDDLLDREQKTLKKEIIQALIYCLVLKRNYHREDQVSAAIYAILQLGDEEVNPYIRMGGSPLEIGEIQSEWESMLTGLLEEVYSPEAVFSQTKFKERCQYCAYRQICRK